MSLNIDKIKEAASFIKSQTSYEAKVGLILGSGLGVLVEHLQNKEEYTFSEIPHMPPSTVEGHEGKIVIGTLKGVSIIALQGRLHYYEGYDMSQVTFPIRLLKCLGITHLIITSACGGINEKLYPGAFMIVNDHLNLMGTNPLIGKNEDEFGPRFPDMSDAYNSTFRAYAHKISQQQNIKVEQGVHAAITGPYYFSNAELKMVQTLGADSIGMSMVPEVIVAVHTSIKCLGIACITDMAVPDTTIEKLTHEKVMEQAEKSRPNFINLVSALVENIDQIL